MKIHPTIINELYYPYIDVPYNGKEYRFYHGINDSSGDIHEVANDIFVDHCYVGGECQISPGDVVLDGGAHIGMFTVFALIHGAKLVISVDPNPDNSAILQYNVERNGGIGKVVFVKSALWNRIQSGRRKRLRFQYFDKFSQSSRMAEHDEYPSRKNNCWVSGVTIDYLHRIHGKIDFIKLDLEMSEKRALLGAGETLKNSNSKLAICLYHKGIDIMEIPNIIKGFNAGYGKPSITGSKYIVGHWNRPESDDKEEYGKDNGNFALV